MHKRRWLILSLFSIIFLSTFSFYQPNRKEGLEDKLSNCALEAAVGIGAALLPPGMSQGVVKLLEASDSSKVDGGPFSFTTGYVSTTLLLAGGYGYFSKNLYESGHRSLGITLGIVGTIDVSTRLFLCAKTAKSHIN